MGVWGPDDARACGAFDVVLEREMLAPGDTLAGVVLFQVLTPIPDAVLSVDVRGRERVEQKDNVEDHTDDSEFSIWFHAITRCRVSLDTDGLDFPFSIEIPTDLPHSSQLAFGSRRDLQTDVSIVYDVVCNLHVPDHTKLDLTRCVPFTVTPLPLARRIGQPLQKSKTHDFRHFLKKSSVELRVELESDVLTVDEEIVARVHLKPDGLDRPKSVAMELLRRIVPNPAHPPVLPTQSTHVSSTRQDHPDLSGALTLRLRIPATMLAEVGPLKPSLAFYHFTVAYQVAVVCEVKGSTPVTVHLPITILPLPSMGAPGFHHVLP